MLLVDGRQVLTHDKHLYRIEHLQRLQVLPRDRIAELYIPEFYLRAILHVIAGKSRFVIIVHQRQRRDVGTRVLRRPGFQRACAEVDAGVQAHKVGCGFIRIVHHPTLDPLKEEREGELFIAQVRLQTEIVLRQLVTQPCLIQCIDRPRTRQVIEHQPADGRSGLRRMGGNLLLGLKDTLDHIPEHLCRRMPQDRLLHIPRIGADDRCRQIGDLIAEGEQVAVH